jgi:tRNA(Ile)-lysidine synthase
MDLYNLFLEHNRAHNLVKTGQKVLLAVSAGVDSMVMLELFQRAGHHIAVAHCNFGLRPGDADLDQILVERKAKQKGIRVFTSTFSTTQFSLDKGISIQMAARELRYNWLEKIRKDNGFDLIATGHNLDDNIETLIINLSRGTGIHGLKGIPLINGNVIRPLLFAPRQAIEAFAGENNIEFRHDLSNFEDKYIRNKIRHQLIPVLRELNPGLNEIMQEFFIKTKAVAEINDREISRVMGHCMVSNEDQISFIINNLKNLPEPAYYLYEVLKAYGFSFGICRQAVGALDNQSGKQFQSSSHLLLKDRGELKLYERRKEELQQHYEVSTDTSAIDIFNCHLVFSRFPLPEKLEWPKDNKAALLDFDLLDFPLLIRPWKHGDYLYPLGMKGRKKVSDLLINSKIDLIEKQKIMVIESNGAIVWVAGLRTDNRFRITKNTKTVFSVMMH